MDTAFKDTFHHPEEMARRAAVYSASSVSLIQGHENPSQMVLDFCVTIRSACSSHNKKARAQFGADSRDYRDVTGWLKKMTMWLTSAEAAGKNLALSPDSLTDIAEAGVKMGLLQTYHQSLELVLD